MTYQEMLSMDGLTHSSLGGKCALICLHKASIARSLVSEGWGGADQTRRGATTRGKLFFLLCKWIMYSKVEGRGAGVGKGPCPFLHKLDTASVNVRMAPPFLLLDAMQVGSRTLVSRPWLNPHPCFWKRSRKNSSLRGFKHYMMRCYRAIIME